MYYMGRHKEAAAKYHTELFERAELFRKGTWLERSDEELLDITNAHFKDKQDVRILDLGCGVGRNAIPIAQIIKRNNGKVVCVDILDIAIKKLLENAERYEVSDVIEAQCADVARYPIAESSFDLTIAQSVLEQGLESKEAFVQAVCALQKGLKEKGVNYFGITTDLHELDAETAQELPKDIGYDATTEEMSLLIRGLYQKWDTLYEQVFPYEEKYVKNGRMIIWKANFFMFAACKPAAS
jgi:SAM-dependent methyltransferase